MCAWTMWCAHQPTSFPIDLRCKFFGDYMIVSLPVMLTYDHSMSRRNKYIGTKATRQSGAPALRWALSRQLYSWGKRRSTLKLRIRYGYCCAQSIRVWEPSQQSGKHTTRTLVLLTAQI